MALVVAMHSGCSARQFRQQVAQACVRDHRRELSYPEREVLVTSWLREHSGTIAVEVLNADEVEAWMGAPPGPLYGEYGFFVRVTLENPDSGLVLEAAGLSGSLRGLDLRSDLVEPQGMARIALASFVPSYDSSEWREPMAARSSSSGGNFIYMLTFGWIVSIMTMGRAPPDALAWEDSMFASDAQRAAKRQRQASESTETPEAHPRTPEAARPRVRDDPRDSAARYGPRDPRGLRRVRANGALCRRFPSLRTRAREVSAGSRNEMRRHLLGLSRS